MKKRTHRRRRVGLHSAIYNGITRAARERQANIIAKPMRKLFAELLTGEVSEVDGRAVLSMPDLDPAVRQSESDWMEISGAIYGWIDLWRNINPAVSLQSMRYLADRLRDDSPLTPRLVEKAQSEYEHTITLTTDLPPGAIERAITKTRIGWEMERVLRQTTEAAA